MIVDEGETMKNITEIINQFDSLVWGIPMLALLLGTGVFLSIRLRFMQFRKFGYIMKKTV